MSYTEAFWKFSHNLNTALQPKPLTVKYGGEIKPAQAKQNMLQCKKICIRVLQRIMNEKYLH